jgi:uncharacterized protein (TIGR03000 family)
MIRRRAGYEVCSPLIDAEGTPMPRNLSRRRFPLAWVCLVLAAARLQGQGPGYTAMLRVQLTDETQLVIDDYQTRQTGPLRRFVSPPLEVGKSYYYTLKWAYHKIGHAVTQQKVVPIQAGDDKEVDLREQADKKAEKKKPEREPDIYFVPTPQNVVDKMLELAEIKKDDVVYDLGCGDGRIVVTAAKKYGCKALGFDIDPERVEVSQQNVKKHGVEKFVTIEEKDIFKLDLRPASVVTLYLLPELNVKLIPQLEKLKAGSRIVSHDFDMKGVKAKKKVTVKSKEDGREHTIYLWVTPLMKE